MYIAYLQFFQNFLCVIISYIVVLSTTNVVLLFLSAAQYVGGENMEDMTRLEILTLLLSLKGLLETDNAEKALEVINNVIAEAQRKES